MKIKEQTCSECGVVATFVTSSYAELPHIWKGSQTRHLVNGPSCLKRQIEQRHVLVAEVKRLQRFEAAYFRLGKKPREIMDFLLSLIDEEAVQIGD